MKTTILSLATVTQLLLYVVSAESTIQKIPFYYHQKRHDSDFITAESQELYNGMLGAVVQIGNPPQNLTLAFDTSTGYSWVRSVDCRSQNCEHRSIYDPKNSTTSVSTGHKLVMNYGGGAVVHSTIYYDTFRFAGLTVEDMPFGVAYCMKGFDKGFDGFLGLGRDINLNATETLYTKRDISASGFVPNAYQQGSGITSAQFGMYTTSNAVGFSDSGYTTSTTTNNTPISNAGSTYPPSTNPSTINTPTTNTPTTNPPVTNAPVTNASAANNVTPGGFGVVKRSFDEPAGYLIFGGVDEDAIEGELYHIETEDDNGSGNWAVPVKSVKFKDDLKFNVKPNAKAILSSNTDVIGLPNAQADEFQKHWYAEYDKPDNTFKIPCCLMDRLTSLKMTLGQVKVTLPPEYWSHPRKVSSCCEMCRTHIGKSDSDTNYILGYSFTNAFYSHFNPHSNQVSFAMKKNQKKNGLKLTNA